MGSFIKFSFTAYFAACLIAVAFFAVSAEADYTDKWCAEHHGQREVIVKGGRVDCLTDQYAVEFGYASKWKEDITQALWYAKQTGKTPAVAMISGPGDEVYQQYVEEYMVRYGVYVKIIVIQK